MNAHAPITTGSITLDARELRKALAFVSQGIERRNTIPVIGMVRITSYDGSVSITGTNLDMWLTTRLDAIGATTPLDVMVAPRLLSGLVHFHDGEVVIERAAGAKGIPMLTITAGDVVAKVNDLCPVEDFPVPVEGFAGAATFSAAEFAKALRPVVPCISTEETRYYLNGVFMTDLDGHLRMVATDGHRLAAYDCAARWPFPSAIFPRQAAQIVLARLGKDSNGTVTIQAHIQHVAQMKPATTVGGPMVEDKSKPKRPELRALRLRGDGWTMTAKIIDGTYPDYTRVIPKPDGSISATISHSAIRRFPHFGERYRPIRLAPDEGKMSVKSPDGIEVSMPMSGKGEAFGLNLRYLLGFSGLGGTIRLEGSRSGDPFLVHSDDPSLTQVVMPMRV